MGSLHWRPQSEQLSHSNTRMHSNTRAIIWPSASPTPSLFTLIYIKKITFARCAR